MSPADVEALALRCVPGSGAATVVRAAGGLVNDSYRVERGGRVFSLRVPSAGPGLGIDRRWECRVLRVAGGAGLAPAVEHCAPESGVVVAHWVEGRAWSAAEAGGAAAIDGLAKLLRAVHGLALPRPLRARSPAEWLRQYSECAGVAAPPAVGAERAAGVALGARTVRQLEAGAAQRLAALSTPSPAATVLCHGDLHRLNVVVRDGAACASGAPVSSGPPVLLDWEYAHASEALWDLGGWIANEDWDAASARALLTAYLLRAPSADEWTRLQHLAWLYDYVCVAWSRCHLRDLAPASRGAVAARTELLIERLVRRAGGLAA